MVKFKPGVLLFPGRLKSCLPFGLFVYLNCCIFNCIHLPAREVLNIYSYFAGYSMQKHNWK
jgi:hypothetical protein